LTGWTEWGGFAQRTAEEEAEEGRGRLDRIIGIRRIGEKAGGEVIKMTEV